MHEILITIQQTGYKTILQRGELDPPCGLFIAVPNLPPFSVLIPQQISLPAQPTDRSVKEHAWGNLRGVIYNFLNAPSTQVRTCGRQKPIGVEVATGITHDANLAEKTDILQERTDFEIFGCNLKIISHGNEILWFNNVIGKFGLRATLSLRSVKKH